MKRTQLLQETRKMQFEEILNIWTERRLTQEEAARMLGVTDRTFRRYLARGGWIPRSAVSLRDRKGPGIPALFSRVPQGKIFQPRKRF